MEKQYREMAKEIGRDVGSLARGGLKGAGKLAFKAAYPVLGNLSANIQGRLEDRLGYMVYFADEAFELSKKINYIVYPVVGAALGLYLSGKVPIESKMFQEHSIFTPEAAKGVFEIMGFLLGGLGGGVYGFVEGGLRDEICNESYVNSSASILGKVVSLPFDLGFWTYDTIDSVSRKAKRYLSGVKERVEGREGVKGNKNLESEVGGGE